MIETSDVCGMPMFGPTQLPPSPHQPEPSLTSTAAAATTTATSVSRSFSDLDTATFATSAALMCAARTAVQHPITLALTRKQTCRFAGAMSTRNVLASICRSEGGPRALMQGMGTMVAACAISEALYLVMIEYLREVLPMGTGDGSDSDGGSSFGRDAMSAYTADVMSRFVYLPLSIISFRQMTQHQFTSSTPTTPKSGAGHAPIQRRGALTVLRSVYAEGGVKSVFCGLGMTLMIGSQWSALWWATYLQLKDVAYRTSAPYLLPDDPSSKLNAFTSRDDNVVVNTAVSIVTSAATSLIFNPFFVLRVNMQLTARATMVGTAKALYNRGGVRAFFCGAYLNMLSSTVDGVLASTSYEYAKILADRSKQL